jgi:hypothetical protein
MAIGMMPKYSVVSTGALFLAASVSDVYWKISGFNDGDQNNSMALSSYDD